MTCLRVFFVSLSFACSLSVFTVEANHPQEDSFTRQQLDHFENEVRPILVRRCNECHAGDETEGGLSLESRKAMLAGGDTGAAIIPGDPKGSLLVKALHYDDVYQMPPDSKLPDEQIKILEDWIRDRAPWPAHADVEIAAAGNGFDIEARKQEHWCWQPVAPPSFPAVDSPSKAIDFFLDAKLKEKGLSANGPANRSSLLRRISFDLTGLPPTQELVEKYAIEEAMPTEAVIDTLLSSPHFGERWARHWMDLARYAETHGHEFDYPIPDAWKYRDYLIRAFNADLPYDQFVTEHIAGDLLDVPRRNLDSQFNESVLATGFWFLGEATHGPVDSKEDETKRIDNQIDVMCRSFIGLTVACARCHDHKFDAISTKDYYALSGFLQSSRRQSRLIDTDRKVEESTKQVGALREKLDVALNAFRDKVAASDVDPGDERLAAVERLRLNLNTVRIINESGEKKSRLEFSANQQDWKTDGFAFANSQYTPAILGDEVQFVDPNSISSAGNGMQFAGVAHSSTFEIKHRYIHIKMKAAKARVELVVDGCRMHEFNPILFKGLIHKDVNHEKFQWLTIGGELYLHQNNRAWLEFRDSGDGFFAVDRIVFSSDKKPPAEPDSTVDAKSIVDLATGGYTNQTLSWILKHELGEVFDAEDDANRIRELCAKVAAVGESLPPRSMAITMTEGFPEDEFVFVRGNHKTLGEVAPRQFLSAIAGEDRSFDREKLSGRRRLAQQIVDPTNPLTSRVIVNRVWHHLFGRGIVRSVDNFGVLGETPSHPELLDHLADKFVKDGWSVKRLIRNLMLTEAYRRSSMPADESGEMDPENILLHRGNVRRLQGEAIRDSMLAASGRLDRKMFGPSVRIHLTPFMRGRGRPKKSGEIDGQGRRSIYIETRRNFLSPMMLAFDTPIPFNAIGNRSVSNVPAQALILMNDPFVLQQADLFASRVVKEADESESRIKLIYRNVLSRMPLADEIEKAKSFIENHAERLGVEQDSTEVWKDFCHVMFNIKEFIYLD